MTIDDLARELAEKRNFTVQDAVDLEKLLDKAKDQPEHYTMAWIYLGQWSRLKEHFDEHHQR